MYYSLFITWRVRKKLELLEAQPRATFTLLSCSLNFPRASLTRYTTYIFVNFQFTKFSFIDFVLTDSRNLSGKRPIRPVANLPVVDFPQTHSNKLCLSLQKGIFLNKVRILVKKKKKAIKKMSFEIAKDHICQKKSITIILLSIFALESLFFFVLDH